MPNLTRRSLLTLPLAAATQRPNIIFVLVDDLRWDELGCAGHPFASTPHADRLAREGALFTNAFAVAPLCSPSRASFLTGLYPHSSGITDNTGRAARSHQLVTWPRLLHDSGYESAFLGKWHMGNDDSPRPGFDHWVSFRGQGECIDPDLNINGKEVSSRGYITDILTGHAVNFLERPRQKPFCLYLAHKAVHPNITQRDDGSTTASPSAVGGFIPASRHRTLYAGLKPPRRPSFGKPPHGKPALERLIDGLPPLGPATATPDEAIRNRMRMMKAVDEGLGRILQTLEKTTALDNTLVVFTSDHGYFYGEHGLDAERRLAYEETIRIPLLMRYPRLIPPHTRIGRFALTVDMAPTALALAGVSPPANLQGRSLLPLFQGNPADWRDAFLIEYFSDTVFPRIRGMGYKAVRTDRWKYIRYNELKGMDELYDLRSDPYETVNRVADSKARALLQDRLDQLLRETGAQK
ncbi:MAG: sulfatase [Bryobacteraceae bacterium]